MGDGVLAYFGYPQAHEHDAERAVRAGLGLVETVPKLRRVFEFRELVRSAIAEEYGLPVDFCTLSEMEARDNAFLSEEMVVPLHNWFIDREALRRVRCYPANGTGVIASFLPASTRSSLATADTASFTIGSLTKRKEIIPLMIAARLQLRRRRIPRLGRSRAERVGGCGGTR